jgi:hypothetical protein
MLPFLMGANGGGCGGQFSLAADGGLGAESDAASEAGTGVDAGVCPAVGCDIACPYGLAKNANGCDTCECVPMDAGPPAAGCTTDGDCAKGSLCGFAVADACTATGQCFVSEQVVCNAFSPGCACDGSVVNTVCNNLPGGYVARPLLHDGACAVAADAGACCPATWGLYMCNEPDGGVGLACHNPELACASSATCGLGCDRVVTGACAP